MSFMVNFRSAEGKPGYHPTDSLEEAVRFVEHLRNQEQVTDARVWRLQEVPLEVKTYYKVVVPSGAPAPAAAAASASASSPGPEPAMAVVGDDNGPKAESAVGAAAGVGGDAGQGANARFGRFNRT